VVQNEPKVNLPKWQVYWMRGIQYEAESAALKTGKKGTKSAKRSNLASKSCRKLGGFSWKLMEVGQSWVFFAVFCDF